MATSTYGKLPLFDLVRSFSVSFRLRPAFASSTGEEPQTGCEVELIGQHYWMGKHVNGGCPHCLKVLVALLELHDHIFSEQEATGPFGAECEKLIRYASTAGDWPEVVLDVKIIRRRQVPLLLPDNWVARLTDEIRTELLTLGCKEIPFVYLPPEPLANHGFLLA